MYAIEFAYTGVANVLITLGDYELARQFCQLTLDLEQIRINYERIRVDLEKLLGNGMHFHHRLSGFRHL